ncbi:Proteinaceous rnase p [Thalictrum thalictroides]|uniref:ribonuclease P n=1 Tax=Thalictrum thalictroides TaxID=46969 RepID=A0A7J6WAI3_THATH|nr:Proteinaceous rnase p [Thalictrum thalictroides]
MENSNQTNHQSKKRKKTLNPEGQFMYDLGTCSKTNDVNGALSLYEKAISQNLRLNHNHFNTLLYLCSNSLHDLVSKASVIEKGFCIYERMIANNINPTEATITAVARLAAAKGDGDFAFQLVKSMGKYKIVPRLRTFDPALFAFCEKLEADKAYEVEELMVSMGICLEEPEFAALLKLSSEVGREDKVYWYLHKVRDCTGCVSMGTAEIIEGWFNNGFASKVGVLDWDENRIKDVMSKNGGGWHGQGWLGKDKWVVSKSNISLEGCCCSCGERLVCVDIDRAETEKFAASVASLATKREAKSDFRIFQEWLDSHAGYEAIVDGANVSLYQQNFAEGGFSISQLEAVVKDLYDKSGKWPLVIMHNKRVSSLMNNTSNQKILEDWQNQGTLYTTPNGSNDDWYWLYAAVKLKCLLVTNDEMRDHIFELFGSNFFLKWKERHRVRFTFLKNNLRLLMPPSYSLVIQESEKGSWHVPIEGECNDELLRTWLCINRPKLHDFSSEVLKSSHSFLLDRPLSPCLHKTGAMSTMNGSHNTPTSFRSVNNEPTAMSGKRKSRSQSPSKGRP